MWLGEVFKLKLSDLYDQGNERLVRRWQELVKNKGEYIVEWFVRTINKYEALK